MAGNPDDAPQWPHNQEGVVVEDGPGLEMFRAPLRHWTGPVDDPDISDVPRTTNGLLDPSVVPPLGKHHLPDLSDDLQARSEKDSPGGYAGLDENGKLSPYALPSLAKGLQGDRGPQGISGGPGPEGAKGSDGRVGPQGPQGRQGETGAQGPVGPRGQTPDLTDVVRVPSTPPTLHLNSDTLARDLAYFLAERGLINLA